MFNQRRIFSKIYIFSVFLLSSSSSTYFKEIKNKKKDSLVVSLIHNIQVYRRVFFVSTADLLKIVFQIVGYLTPESTKSFK